MARGLRLNLLSVLFFLIHICYLIFHTYYVATERKGILLSILKLHIYIISIFINIGYILIYVEEYQDTKKIDPYFYFYRTFPMPESVIMQYFKDSSFICIHLFEFLWAPLRKHVWKIQALAKLWISTSTKSKNWINSKSKVLWNIPIMHWFDNVMAQCDPEVVKQTFLSVGINLLILQRNTFKNIQRQLKVVLRIAQLLLFLFSICWNNPYFVRFRHISTNAWWNSSLARIWSPDLNICLENMSKSLTMIFFLV